MDIVKKQQKFLSLPDDSELRSISAGSKYVGEMFIRPVTLVFDARAMRAEGGRRCTRRRSHLQQVGATHARTTLISRLARRVQLTKRASVSYFLSSLRAPFFFFSPRVLATCAGSTRSSRICFFPSYFRALLAANAYRQIDCAKGTRKREHIRVAFGIASTRVRTQPSVH